MDILDAVREFRFQSEWERRFHEYDLLLAAGVDADEAEKIVRHAAADRRAVTVKEIAA
ncbi:hypothetical protein [Mesorhizobium sp. M2D.F.Ca.ET.223.01.1.1]|uniref:hypothetical protein n=1 Tax=Mesorhizobium sp. M2D.F.Ca.ET.223.01.1.1 TaxID=2563940 RepID=UPI00142F1E5D|nr:hypothetical protein [Mesorhizobium sp. M2D.F.Ca.ET.223.01.1.1]